MTGPLTEQARPLRVGICWVDAETFWWDAEKASVCPVCGEDDEGYAEQHRFFAAEAALVQAEEQLAWAEEVLCGDGWLIEGQHVNEAWIEQYREANPLAVSPEKNQHTS